MSRDFPESFLFGAATSAYQVEGGIENDWSQWERQGRTKTPAGRAADHWNRFEEDFDLLVAAGLNAYRLSIEWARLEPSPGRFDDAALAQYRRLLEALKRRGVKAMVTLHHFTHPTWFHERTPWTSPASVAAFERFTRHVVPTLAGLVDSWCTLNEPMVLLLGGYAEGQMPPGQKDLKAFAAAAGNMLRAHVAARAALSELTPGVPVGLAHNALDFAPLRRLSPVDRLLAASAETLYLHALPDALTEGELRLRMPGLLNHRERIDGAAGSLDWLGVNYYTRIHVGAQLGGRGVQAVYRDPHGRGLTDLGWELWPEGFGRVLAAFRKYRLPLVITENGIADVRGDRRVPYLLAHLRALRDAMRAGADVRGYFHWSLLDNFEWLEGLGPRFGLYRVDFDTLERSPTEAVAVLRDIARTGRLP